MDWRKHGGLGLRFNLMLLFPDAWVDRSGKCRDQISTSLSFPHDSNPARVGRETVWAILMMSTTHSISTSC